jgi:putative selenium metabolism protein SsnA
MSSASAMSLPRAALRARGAVVRRAAVAIPQSRARRAEWPFQGVVGGRKPGDTAGPTGTIVVHEGRIAAVGADDSDASVQEALKGMDSPVEIDAKGGLVLPGLVLAHGHFYGTFARGLALQDPPARNFQQVLDRLWWKLDKALGPDGVAASAKVCTAAAIRSGTTTIFDHHSSPSFVRGSLAAIAEVTSGAGVRANLAYEVSDRNGPENAREAIEENAQFMRDCLAAPEDQRRMLSASFGLHASFTLSDATLRACVEARGAMDGGFHIHVAEGPGDRAQCKEEHGTTIVKRLAGLGVLGTDRSARPSIIGHAVYLEDDELADLAKYNVAVCHNPSSNMNNGVGRAPIENQRAAGLPVALGTDGMTYDVLEESRIAYLVGKHELRDPSAAQGDLISDMVFHENAVLAEKYFGLDGMGQIEVGAPADLAILEYDSPTPVTEGNLPWHLVFGTRSRHVTGTICDGVPLMLGRELLEHTGLRDADDFAFRACPEVWASSALDATPEFQE